MQTYQDSGYTELEGGQGFIFPGIDPDAIDKAIKSGNSQGTQNKEWPDPTIRIKSISTNGKVICEFN